MIAALRQLGLTPAKGALLAFLAIGLGVVWGPQLAGMLPGDEAPATVARGSGASPARGRPTPSRRRAARAPAPRPAAKPRDTTPQPELATITLAEAVAYDPFAPPAWSPASGRKIAAPGGRMDEAAVAELEERFGVLRESGIAMILITEKGRAVQIGDQTLKVGDKLEGFEIVEISAGGVVFQPATTAEGDDRGA